MKLIEILSLFRDGTDTYHVGEVRMVSEEKAGYFCGLGWAKADGLTTGSPDTSEKTLEVQNSTIGHAAPELGVK